jgi:hypothetical protein
MSKQCEICGTTENSGIRLVRDHNHATGYVRGMLCDPCNARVGHYETGVLFTKYKASYDSWLVKHKVSIEEYLRKPPTSIMYTKSIIDEVTGFTIKQLKQQARSLKSKHREVAISRLKELQLEY